jgi:hypothetical protein
MSNFLISIFPKNYPIGVENGELTLALLGQVDNRIGDEDMRAVVVSKDTIAVKHKHTP